MQKSKPRVLKTRRTCFDPKTFLESWDPNLNFGTIFERFGIQQVDVLGGWRRSFGRKRRKRRVFLQKHGSRAALEQQASLKHHAHLLQPLSSSAKMAPAWARRPVQTQNKELHWLIQRDSVFAQLPMHRHTPLVARGAERA